MNELIVPIQHQLRLDHVTSFADAIFAFSITFMAISIDIPNLAQNLTQTQVVDKLLESIPEFEIYAISFFVIGVYWIAYHQTFNQIVNSDTPVTWLTLVFLFFITLIPLATKVEIGFGYQIVFVLFALVLAIAGALLTIIWLHAVKNKLIDKDLTQREMHTVSLGAIIPTVVYFLSILVSFIDLQAAYYFWIVIIPVKAANLMSLANRNTYEFIAPKGFCMPAFSSSARYFVTSISVDIDQARQIEMKFKDSSVQPTNHDMSSNLNK